jgi:hypothetical protein
MLGFFKKAKEYASGIMSHITHLAASSTPVPSSSTPPPGAIATESSAPSTAMEPAAEVA